MRRIQKVENLIWKRIRELTFLLGFDIKSTDRLWGSLRKRQGEKLFLKQSVAFIAKEDQSFRNLTDWTVGLALDTQCPWDLNRFCQNKSRLIITRIDADILVLRSEWEDKAFPIGF